MIRVQASLYPLECPDPDEVIKRSISVLESHGVQCNVGPVSTEFSGDDEAVWRGLRAAFESARSEGGEVSMTVTITNSEP